MRGTKYLPRTVVSNGARTLLNRRCLNFARDRRGGNCMDQRLKTAMKLSTTSLDPTIIAHFVRGGTPGDPAPPPFHLVDTGEDSLYTLVLLRHGESEWNAQNRYTGWHDVDLAVAGEAEAVDSGRIILESGIEIDHAFTSLLKRACNTADIVLNTARQHWVPVTKSWRLNERHYGALTGYKKDIAWKELGLDQELVVQMRRSYDMRPPRMDDGHKYWHGGDRRYANLTREQLEQTRAESLDDVASRILPFFNSIVIPSLRAGNKCMVVSHANTLRTLIKHIDGISDDDVKGLSIPTAVPMLYRLDKQLRPVDPATELDFRYMVEPKGFTWGASRSIGFKGSYLGTEDRLSKIHGKKDTKHRDWQRVMLRKLYEKMVADSRARKFLNGSEEVIIDTQHLLRNLQSKMKEQPEYSKMILLVQAKEWLEEMVFKRNRSLIASGEWEVLVDKLYQGSEGLVVDPFVPITEGREERQRLWYENLVADEYLVK